MKKVRVDSPGLLTTVQDIGRNGFQKYGVSVSGCMDSYSMQIANILVGNKPDEALLECTMTGPCLTFFDECIFAVAGADMNAVLNGKKIACNGSYKAGKGDTLRLQTAKQGMRNYIAFSGGIAVESVMGSKSTYLKAGFGGYEGRRLEKGDFIEIGDSEFGHEACRISESDAVFCEGGEKVRVIMGPENDMFTEKGISTFLEEEFVLSGQCDRMGLRLDGPEIEHIGGADILSGGITLGAVQVPGHGHPIIMMADRQTTGGYSKIANVITVDIDRLAQMRPGDKIRFEAMEPAEAQSLLRRRQERIEILRNEILDGKRSYGEAKEYKIRINGEIYDVAVREAIER